MIVVPLCGHKRAVQNLRGSRVKMSEAREIPASISIELDARTSSGPRPRDRELKHIVTVVEASTGVRS